MSHFRRILTVMSCLGASSSVLDCLSQKLYSGEKRGEKRPDQHLQAQRREEEAEGRDEVLVEEDVLVGQARHQGERPHPRRWRTADCPHLQGQGGRRGTKVPLPLLLVALAQCFRHVCLLWPRSRWRPFWAVYTVTSFNSISATAPRMLY